MATTNDDVLQELKNKSEDDYEKNITLISAGSLALTITFLSEILDVEKSHSFWLVITSWSVLALTLISNLCSHLYSSWIMDKCKGDPEHVAYTNWARRCYKIRVWNIINVGALMIGIFFFVIFVSINIPAMAKGQQEHASRPNTEIETHGRTPAKPDIKVQPLQNNPDTTKGNNGKNN